MNDVDASDNEDETKQYPIQHSICRLLYSECHWKCFLLTLLLCGCLSAIAWCKVSLEDHRSSLSSGAVSLFDRSPSPPQRTGGRSAGVYACEDSYVYIPVAFVIVIYILYLVECWHCRIRLQLLGSVDAGAVYAHVRALREAHPVVWWKAVCYHYVRRTRQVARYRNGGGATGGGGGDAFTTAQVYYERVNSHVGTGAFDYAGCGVKDVSRRLADLEKFPSTKIRFTKRFSFATHEAEAEFERQREAFFSGYERRDDYVETREGVDFLNVSFRDQMVVFADPRRLPWYVSNAVFWAASVVLLSWPIRVLIQYKTAYVHYYVHKVFGGNYFDQGRGSRTTMMMMMMTREDTMGSHELEMSIRSNYALVPSYSEALLMECADRSDRPDRSLRMLRPGSEPASCPPSKPLFVSSSGELRSYGAVAMATGERDSPPPSSTRALGCPRRLRRSYCEAVCVGDGSTLTIDRRRSGTGRTRRSLMSLIVGGGGGGGGTRIVSSVSSPDSIAARTADPNAELLGRPGSWNGIPHPPDSSSSPSSSSVHRIQTVLRKSQSGTWSSDGAAGPDPVELPPSYELALNMEQVRVAGDDVRDDDVVSVSTTSTYVTDSVHVTPRHQVTRARRTSGLDVVFVSRSVETTI